MSVIYYAKLLQLNDCVCRVMLSDKLLSKTDYNCDREIRTLELLKLRFGDANLHNCEASCHHRSSCTSVSAWTTLNNVCVFF